MSYTPARRHRAIWSGASITMAIVIVIVAIFWGGKNKADCAERGGIYGRSPYGNSDVMVCVGPEGRILRTY